MKYFHRLSLRESQVAFTTAYDITRMHKATWCSDT